MSLSLSEWLFSSLRCGGKWLQMWNWGIWRLGWGEPAETRPPLLLYHPTVQQLHIGTQTEWDLLSYAGTTPWHLGCTRPAPDNRPTAGHWPRFCPCLLCINHLMVFWDNRAHRDANFEMKSLRGSLPNYSHSVSNYWKSTGCMTQLGTSFHGVCRSLKSSRSKTKISKAFTYVIP